jgi:hypothetical protein
MIGPEGCSRQMLAPFRNGLAAPNKISVDFRATQRVSALLQAAPAP